MYIYIHMYIYTYIYIDVKHEPDGIPRYDKEEREGGWEGGGRRWESRRKTEGGGKAGSKGDVFTTKLFGRRME